MPPPLCSSVFAVKVSLEQPLNSTVSFVLCGAVRRKEWNKLETFTIAFHTKVHVFYEKIRVNV